MDTPWLTIAELSNHLSISKDDINRLFIIGKLRPAICLPSTRLLLLDNKGTKTGGSTNKHGIFELIGYEKIRWIYPVTGYGDVYCDLYRDRLTLRQHDEFYEIPETFKLSQNKILITNENVKEFESEYGVPRKQAKEAISPNAKAQESLMKMVIAMAIDAYGFDPNDKRSPIPAEIVGHVEELGLSIDVDTVWKWLREGAALLPQDYKESN